MKLLDVEKIGFHRGENRTPEDFTFPAAMTSMMAYLDESFRRTQIIHAHGREWTQRVANVEFVAASGIGFALLWEKDYCMGAMDLIQAGSYEKGIQNSFAWAGWEYERVSGADMRSRAVAAIDEGHPFIAFGLTDPPEAALVCGYDDEGRTLCGWSHFQDGMATVENGMFQVSGWESHTWEFCILTRKTERTLSPCDIVAFGVEIMEKTQADGYFAGDAAHAAWQDTLASCGTADAALFGYHDSILFNLAEARAWCGDFLKSQKIEAGKHFGKIHELCWEAHAAVPNAEALAVPEKRAALLRVMEQIRAEDKAARSELRAYLQS